MLLALRSSCSCAPYEPRTFLVDTPSYVAWGKREDTFGADVLINGQLLSLTPPGTSDDAITSAYSP